MTGRGWQSAIGLQAAVGQASWLGIRLSMAYLALSLGGDATYVGLQAAVFAAAGLVMALPAGRLADRRGGAVVGSSGLALLLVGVPVVLLFPSLTTLMIAPLIFGIGHVGTLVGQQALVAQLGRGAGADAAFGTLSAMMATGQLIGPPLVTGVATLLAAPGEQINANAGLIVCGVLITCALVPFGFLRRAQRTAAAPTEAPRKVRLGDVLRIKGMWRALVVSGSVIVAVDLLASFLPVWAVERDVSAVAVGWLLALRALVTISSRVGMTRLIARFGRSTLLVVAVSTAAIALAALAFVNIWGAIVVMCLIGIGLGLPQPLTMAWVVALAPGEARGVVLGARMTVNRLAQVSIPLTLSALAGPFGVGPIFVTTAVLLGASAILARSAPSEGLSPRTDDESDLG